jgi:hypothetical protein
LRGESPDYWVTSANQHDARSKKMGANGGGNDNGVMKLFSRRSAGRMTLRVAAGAAAAFIASGNAEAGYYCCTYNDGCWGFLGNNNECGRCGHIFAAPSGSQC